MKKLLFNPYIILILLFAHCAKFDKLISINTGSSSDIKLNTAIVKGEIIDNGEGISTYGHCWSKTNNMPTKENCDSFSIFELADAGTFQSDLTGLNAETTYYTRAYATSNELTVYGETISFTTIPATIDDVSGYTYNLVQIGEQVWTKENLKTTKYRNGDIIGTTDPLTLNISNDASPKYQWAYSGDELMVYNYGRLYTWYAAVDNRNICPTGWHVSSDEDWTVLTNYLKNNGYSFEGNGDDVAMSLASKYTWFENITIGGNVGNDPASNNSTGFSATAGGFRFNNGTFSSLTNKGFWWCSDESNASNAWFRSMGFDLSRVNRTSMNKDFGYSIRCIKD
jgi:uncharacterized protein (TIGR02145 family)